MFYTRFVYTVYRASAMAKRGQYTAAAWSESCYRVLRALERVGVRFEVAGVRNLQGPAPACVVIGNHMSTLETVILPVIIRPFRDVTFVVKDSLVVYPVFRHIMGVLSPIPVTRTDPRQDLKAVLEQGQERLERGMSVVVFPQTTRTHVFDPDQFSTLGVKLARRAGVPIVPMALRTDAWDNGRILKDFGRIHPSRRVHFEFGEPMEVQGRGAEEHEAISDFIRARLQEWSSADSNG
jgi:1-acyl-sn-glycerol-3-phosphate acyltransferase